MNVDYVMPDEKGQQLDSPLTVRPSVRNRGYFGIGIFQPQKHVNIGTLFRSAYSMGASFIYTIGRKYNGQCSDTTKADKHIPLYNYISFESFLTNIPRNCRIVGVELDERAFRLANFVHPERAIYLLGSEGDGLPERVRTKCHALVQLPGSVCLNVSVAGSILMYDRIAKSA